MVDAPNLFDFATSELSQDAFLSWLVSHADCDSRPELQAAAKGFIAMLWNAAKGAFPVGGESITLLSRPRRQVEKIDVLFEASVAGRPAIFLIEDKTDTSHHSDQLARYRTHIASTQREHELVLIYLKTGFHFDTDASAIEHGYAIIDLRQIIDCLRIYKVRSDIYEDYVDRARRLLEHREQRLAELKLPEGYKALRDDFVQFTLARELESSCKENIGGLQINRGRSLGGAPWTHLRFARFPAMYDGSINEVLYHRIDARKDDNGVRRYYLCTRQYARVKDSPAARKAKTLRLAELRKLFKQAEQECHSGLAFGKPTTDKVGGNESEIAILFFDDALNSVENVLARMKHIHARFVALVDENMMRA